MLHPLRDDLLYVHFFHRRQSTNVTELDVYELLSLRTNVVLNDQFMSVVLSDKFSILVLND